MLPVQGEGSMGLGRGAAQFAPPVRVGPSGVPGAMCPQAQVAPPGCLMLDGGRRGHREGGGVIWAGPGPCPPWWRFAAKPWGWGDSEHAWGWWGEMTLGCPACPSPPNSPLFPHLPRLGWPPLMAPDCCQAVAVYFQALLVPGEGECEERGPVHPACSCPATRLLRIDLAWLGPRQRRGAAGCGNPPSHLPAADNQHKKNGKRVSAVPKGSLSQQRETLGVSLL